MINADKAKEITRQANNEDQKLNKMQRLAFQLMQAPEFLRACEESILKIIDEEVNKSAHDGLSECTVSTCLEFVSGIGTGHFLKNSVALSDLHITNLFKKLLPVLTHNEGNPYGIPYYYALSGNHFDGTGRPQLNRCYQFQISGELLEAINKELGKTIRTDLRIAGYKLNSLSNFCVDISW